MRRKIAHWRKRAEINADVVYFPYVAPDIEAQADEIYIWDLDKTYLDTKFETLKGLLRTFFEKPFQKLNVAGTGALVRSLTSAWQERPQAGPFPIYFITASPPQLERRILEKLNLDGIHPFGLFCKDNLQNLRPRRLWRLAHQIGYKLQALLQMRVHLGEEVRQILWGDDSESDVIIYCLYSDICARRLSEKEIRKILKGLKVVGNQTETILELQSQVPVQDPVEKIYINLAEDTDAEYYLKFGRRTLPTYNTFQTALDLFQNRKLRPEHVIAVAQDMIFNFGYTNDELEKSFDELIRRKILGEPAVNEILPVLQAQGVIHSQFEPSLAPKPVSSQPGSRVVEVEGSFEPWVPERIDYLHNYR